MGSGKSSSSSQEQSESGFSKKTRDLAGKFGTEEIIPRATSKLDDILGLERPSFTIDDRGLTPEQATLYDKLVPGLVRSSTSQVSAGLGRRGFLRPENVTNVGASAGRRVGQQLLPLLLANALQNISLRDFGPINFETQKLNAITNASNIGAQYGVGSTGSRSTQSSQTGPSPFNALIPTFSLSGTIPGLKATG